MLTDCEPRKFLRDGKICTDCPIGAQPKKWYSEFEIFHKYRPDQNSTSISCYMKKNMKLFCRHTPRDSHFETNAHR